MKVWMKNLYRVFFDKYKFDQGKYTILKHYGGGHSLLMRFKREDKKKYYGGSSRDVYREEDIDQNNLIEYISENKEEMY